MVNKKTLLLCLEIWFEPYFKSHECSEYFYIDLGNFFYNCSIIYVQFNFDTFSTKLAQFEKKLDQ